MFHELLTTPWWVYDPKTTGSWGLVYRWFNLWEGATWLVFAALVLCRWWMHRRSRLEIAYGLAFLLFGLTDFVEAYQQSAALVLIKCAILLPLPLRHRTLTQYYPRSRVY